MLLGGTPKQRLIEEMKPYNWNKIVTCIHISRGHWSAPMQLSCLEPPLFSGLFDFTNYVMKQQGSGTSGSQLNPGSVSDL